MAKTVSLKTLIARSTAAVTTFGTATGDFRTAMRNASIATVAAIMGGEVADVAIERAKLAYDYASKDKQAQGTFRQWATDVRTVAAGIGSLSEEDRNAFLNGEKPASSVASALKKPERDKAKAEKQAEAEKAEKAEQERIAREAPRVITPAEMGVHFASWLDTLGPQAKLSKAQSGAIGAVLESLAGYRERVASTAREVAKAA